MIADERIFSKPIRGLNRELIAIVAEGKRGQTFISANDKHMQCAEIPRPVDYPDAKMPYNPRDFKTPNYGLNPIFR